MSSPSIQDMLDQWTEATAARAFGAIPAAVPSPTRKPNRSVVSSIGFASHSGPQRLFARSFSSSSSPSSDSSGHGLSHVDASGTRPTMVDVGHKSVTKREAVAQARVLLPTNVAQLFQADKKDWNTPKGPVLVTAIIAGTTAVKQTSALIPFCHPLPLDNCRFTIDFVPHAHPLGDFALYITCRVSCTAKTGVEMEALTGASVAALTCYDMLKAVSHDLVITDVKLVKKTGGKSDYTLPKAATNKQE